MAATATIDVPVSDIDPFSDTFFNDPYPFHAQLRETAPVVWLSKYESTPWRGTRRCKRR